jgi:hypothetical protein
MAQYNISNATTTDFSSKVPDFIVESIALDIANSNKEETSVYYPEATDRFGYYLKIPEIYSAINAMATWAFGAGFSANPTTKAELDHVTGMGKDTFEQIIFNHEVIKLIVGDAFIEVVRGKTGICFRSVRRELRLLL